jgi:hypothetical protein
MFYADCHFQVVCNQYFGTQDIAALAQVDGGKLGLDNLAMSISSTTVRTFRGRVCQAFRRLFSSVPRGVWQALIIATGTLELTNSRVNVTVREMCGCFATARLATRWL